jgi:hypothetical protein
LKKKHTLPHTKEIFKLAAFIYIDASRHTWDPHHHEWLQHMGKWKRTGKQEDEEGSARLALFPFRFHLITSVIIS